MNDLDRNDASVVAWDRAFLTVLGEAINDLQELIFDEGWNALVASSGGTEAALRESVRHYERGIAHLLGFVRAAGVPESPVAWSELKANLRRSALETGQEITLRTALDSALYASEQIPLGEHLHYRQYVGVLFELLSGRGSLVEHPGPRASLEDRLDWGYALLADLEDHAAFDIAVHEVAMRSVHAEEIQDVERRIAGLQRFDLILSTCLLWLAETGGISDPR